MQRALKFARYLPGYGWEPTVLTVRPEDAAYPDLDETLEAEVPATLRVERTGAWDPYALYARLQGKEKHETVGVGFLGESRMNWKQRLGRWLRANVFLPDARVGWVPAARRRAEALLREAPFDAVLTTGPPHSAHLVGRRLARRHGLPWVADFRDPWTGIDFYDDLPMTALARRLDAALERSVLKEAGGVVVVSEAMRRHLAARVPAAYEVIQNGFDPADFEGQAFIPGVDFVLAYVGNLNAARNPEALWQALAALDAPTAMPGLRLRFVGNVDPAALDRAAAHGVASMVEVLPYVPHAEAVRHMCGSTLLLLVINRVAGAEGITTGKLYEYLASGRPVLGLGPMQGDAAAVLEDSGAGRMFDYDDAPGVAAWIREHYAAWAAGHPLHGADAEGRRPYSRKAQAGALADLLGRVASV